MTCSHFTNRPTELQEKENLLTLEQARFQDFSKRVHDLEAISSQKNDELRQALQREKELTEKCRDQVCAQRYFFQTPMTPK